MTDATEGDPLVPESSRTARSALDWVDQQGRAWHVQLNASRVILRSGDQILDLPATDWSRDIYIASHGARYIIRLDTFDLAISFLLPEDQASPFLAHVGRESAAEPTEPVVAEVCREAEPLLWPRVSPLAVWALVCSAVVFVPVVGLPAAVVTVVLLIEHRRRVRRAPSWSHSRALCSAAFIFLLAGLVVSALATAVLVQNVGSVRSDDKSESSLPPPDPYRGASFRTAPSGGSGDLDWLENVNWAMLAAGLFVVLVSLTFHEAAHATAAWWLGDDFARRIGRVTLNPLSHIDPVGTVLLPLILFLARAGVFGWARPVPVRTEVLARPRRDHILISIAGPGANLLLAAASLLLLLGIGAAVSLAVPDAEVVNYASFGFASPVEAAGFAFAPVFAALCTVLKLGFIVNAFLAFFNLIPIPPLDGSWVLEHLFPSTLGQLFHRIRPYGFLLFLALIYSGVLQYLLLPVALVMVPGLLLLDTCTVFH